VAEAVAMPAKRGIVQRLNFCIWTQAHTRWISDEQWMTNAGAVKAEAIAGREAYAGVVVSSPYELFALVLWVPDDDGGGDVLPFFWVPEEKLTERAQRHQVPYDVWVAQGYMTAVGGEVLEFGAVGDKLKELADVYDVKEVAVMRYNALQLMTDLDTAGFSVYQYTAQMKDMSPGTKELGKLLTQKKVRHGGHPVLRWMAANMAVKTDANQDMRPDKEMSRGQFAGIEGLIVGISRWAAAKGEDETEWTAV